MFLSTQNFIFKFLYSCHMFYAIIKLLMRIKIPRFLTCIRNRGMKKANLGLLHGTRLASTNTLSITKILKNARVEVKKDLQAKKISSEVFFRYQDSTQIANRTKL